MTTRKDGKIAFALGGLGGVNAHGVGFLEAARALNIEPSIISCTSGMIARVADWLDGVPLQPLLEEQLRQGVKFPPPFHWMNTLWLATFGDPGSFRPAIREYWTRWLKPLERPDARSFFDRFWPAQLYVPQRTPEELSRIAEILNASSIPVMFNSYHPGAAREYLHVNHAACDFLEVKTGEIGGSTKYLPIDSRAVRGALWLYFYGFDENANPEGLVDGAYHRQFIVSELHACDRIYVARPRNSRWDDRLPGNYFEVQDFTTDLWFDSSFTAELAGLRQINQLLAHGRLKGDFHPVDIIEVEVERKYGFFECLVDERELFEQAFRKAYRELTVKECETAG
ncbi:MAG: hypothetical protein WCF85_13900 [Rhodospirillaceae bacterium]